MSWVYDITEHGAKGDGETLDTVAIQAAIDACHEAGGGRVVCPPGRFRTGTVELRSNVELHLEAGCVLAGSEDLADYPEFEAEGFIGEKAPENSRICLLRADRAEHIAVTGPGEINAMGLSFFDTTKINGRFFAKPETPRPRHIMFFQCRDVHLERSRYIDSPCWSIWLMQCECVTVRDLVIEADQRMINSDGLHIDACKDVVVSGCLIRTGDDCIIARALQRVYAAPAICERVAVTNCVLKSRCQGVRVGVTGDHVVRDCVFTNLVIHSENNGIAMQNPHRYHREGDATTLDLSNVSFTNVIIDCPRFPLWIMAEDGVKLARIEDLRFSDFRIRSGGPVVVRGCPETMVRDVRFANMHIDTASEQALDCRHVENLHMTNVTWNNRPAG